MERSIAVIDLKSFYATVECVERNVDPFTTPLVVCDVSRGNGTIVLAVSPYLKTLHVPSRCRRYELPYVKGMIFATPQMELYVKKSAEVVSIFLDFVGEDDIHVYSIDEAFLDLTPYLKMYKMTDVQLVKKIMDTIHDKLGLFATAGIGNNMFLAKAALDNESKTSPDFIAKWTMGDVKTKLWPITPLTEMWGISHNLQKRLNALGIRKVGDLAQYPLEIIKEKFGVIGEELYNHANGIDEAQIREKYIPESTSLTIGQVLFRDYTFDETKLIIREMNDELCNRLRSHHMKTDLIFLGVGFSKPYNGGFGKQISLDKPTDDNDIIYKALMNYYNQNRCDQYMRRISVAFGSLSNREYEQIDLFVDIDEVDKKKSLYTTLDEIQKQFGKNAVLRTTSELEESTIKERHNQIGGHRK